MKKMHIQGMVKWGRKTRQGSSDLVHAQIRIGSLAIMNEWPISTMHR